MSVNGYEVKEKLFAKEKIEMSKVDYDNGGRQVIFEYLKRSEDVGNQDLIDHCKGELARLDQEHGNPQASQR